MRQLLYSVPEKYNEKPLLHFFKSELKFSTRIVQSLIHTDGSVKRNGEKIRVIDKIFTGDKIEIILPEKSTSPLLWEKELDIVYEDEDILVINKPAGISCHPSHNHPNFTLANAVAYYLKNTGDGEKAARAVGRLDKGTSGLIVFAKNIYSASRLNGKIEKIYIALATKYIEESGIIEKPIYRPDPNKTLRDTGENGDYALTEYEPLSHHGNYTLCKVRIKTGRTHQIRVHFKSIGAPLLGDDMYGAETTVNLTRPALHCSEVFFTHPATGNEMHFCVPLPEDIKKEILR